MPDERLKYAWIDDLKRIIELLVQHRFHEVAQLTHGQLLSEEEIRQAVAEYGRTLVAPPEYAYDVIDVVPIHGQRQKWSVRMPLWTREEGQSDLTLELTVLDAEQGRRPTFTIDGIHVL